MFLARQLVRNNIQKLDTRCYTVIVERVHKPPPTKKGVDQRMFNLKSKHYQLKFVDCLHDKPWGHVELILTDYVEGIGHKGEIVRVQKNVAYHDLLPRRLAVYPTEEYMKLYEKDREEVASKSKVSQFAAQTREQLNKMILQIPVNMSTDWKLTVDSIRIALRYNKIMCPNESIHLPKEYTSIDSKNYENFKDPFEIKIKVNDYVTANLKCQIVPLNKTKLWEDFSIFNKTI